MASAHENSPKTDNKLTTVVIRVDASTRIGTGHVMRCLTLAKKLAEHGSKVIFLAKQHQGNLNSIIKKQGFKLFELSAPKESITRQTDEKYWLGCSYHDDAQECLLALNGITVDLLIVDHYSLDYQWQSLMKANVVKQQTFKIMVIDDLANREYKCDLLLDQTLGREQSDYIKLVPKDCLLLLGADFIMLRDEFSQHRQLATTKRAQTSSISNILITLGGTDPDNIAEKLLHWLITFKQTQPAIQVTLVANPASSFIDKLTKISISHRWINLISQPKSMAKIMLKADIAIGTSGATAWERCCLGLPSLSIISAENQNFLNDNLVKQGAIISMGHFTTLTYDNFEKSLNDILNNKHNYQQMSKLSFACCDGLGVTKVYNSLVNSFCPKVYLQKASYDDCQDIFNWQSNTEIRKYSHNSEPVEWHQHCSWLRSTVANDYKHLYMIKLKVHNSQTSLSVGLLRLDRRKKTHDAIDAGWLISILIASEMQGKKLAEQAINAIAHTYKKQGIIAEVHLDNLASHRLFIRSGFRVISPTLYYLKTT